MTSTVGQAALVPALARYLRTVAPRVLLSHLDVLNVAALVARACPEPGRRYVRLLTRQGRLPGGAGWAAGSLGRRGIALAIPPRGRRRGGVGGRGGRPRRSSRVSHVPAFSVIHNPMVNEELLSAGINGRPPLARRRRSACRWSRAGRLNAQKDYRTLLRAFRRAAERRPLRLLILGEGKQRPRLEGLARELGMADDVEFQGYVTTPIRTSPGVPIRLVSALGGLRQRPGGGAGMRYAGRLDRLPKRAGRDPRGRPLRASRAGGDP